MIIRRYITREVGLAIGFVLLALLALFFLLDLLGELDEVGQAGYRIEYAALYVLLRLPSITYEVLPLAALIGAIYALSQFAANAEYTIMRTSGLSARSAAWILIRLSLLLVAGAFVIGEYIAPPADSFGNQMRLARLGKTAAVDFRSGLWIKDVMTDAQRNAIGTRFVNAERVKPDGSLQRVQIFEFDSARHLLSLALAESAYYEPPTGWRLVGVTETRFTRGARPQGLFAGQELVYESQVIKQAERLWPAQIDPNVFASVFVEPKKMPVTALWKYVQHLKETKQKTSLHEIALWKKATYPLAIIVMLLLALPFAYLHVRSGGLSLKIFIGIMIGIAFHLFNNLTAHLGVLNEWPPALVALTPSAVALIAATLWLRWVERH